MASRAYNIFQIAVVHLVDLNVAQVLDVEMHREGGSHKVFHHGPHFEQHMGDSLVYRT
jgi:hypothetical protein